MSGRVAFAPWIQRFLTHGAAVAGRAGRIIQRTQKARLVLQQFQDFLLIPQMVAGSDGVHSVGKEIGGDVGSDPVAAGGIFAIGDDDVQPVNFAQLGQQFLDGAAPGAPDNVPDKQYFHADI